MTIVVLRIWSVRCLPCADRSGKSFSDKTVAVFNIDSQSGRELRQYLSSVASRCAAKSSAKDVDNDVEGERGDELPVVIVLDGLHRITSTPLSDIFSSLLNVELCYRSAWLVAGLA